MTAVVKSPEYNSNTLEDGKKRWCGFEGWKKAVEERNFHAIDCETSDGIHITSISDHGYKRMRERGVTVGDVIDSLENPLNICNTRYEKDGKPSK